MALSRGHRSWQAEAEEPRREAGQPAIWPEDRGTEA